MKLLLLFTVTVFLFACMVKPTKRYSHRQQQIEQYIQHYQTSYSQAADSASKAAVLDIMWAKHMRFLQDTLGFSFYPVRTIDTFYFEKIALRYDTLVSGTSIEVLLQSERYDARCGYVFSTGTNEDYNPLYKALRQVNTGKPVYAAFYIQDFGFNIPLLKNGTLRPQFEIMLETVFNP